MSRRSNGRARLRASAVGLLALILAPAASAHPYLVASTPQGGVVATSAPTQITIAFTEHLVLQGCSITLRDARGHMIGIGHLRPTLGGDGIVASLASVPEGIYSVDWVALGDDGHTVAGSYKFGIPGAHGQAPPGADKLLATTTTAGTERAPTESFLSIGGRWLAALAAFALLGGAVLLSRMARRLEGPVAADAERRWRRLAVASLGLALIGTLVEAGDRVRAPGGGVALGLLTGSTSGTAVLVRLAVLLAGGLVLAPGLRRRLRGDGGRIALGTTGALALGALAIDGHVATVRGDAVLAGVAMAVHLLAAGIWVGGVIVLAACVAPAAFSAARPAQVLAAGRAFVPVAVITAALTIFTGVIAAVREVSRWYFLRWSTYGHLVLVKGGLVVIVLGLGAGTTWAARRALRRPADVAPSPPGSGGVLRGARVVLTAEAVIGVAVIAVAATLAGTLQGRGQPLPSQRGVLLPGAGFADIATGSAIADLTVAPARIGLNRVVVALQPAYGPRGSTPPIVPRRVSVAISCDCGGRTVGLAVPLHPGSGGGDAWWGNVELPLDGVWSAQVKVDGRPAVGSPSFTVGVPAAPGSAPLTVASVADLSGPDALYCRSQEIGSLLSIELMNLVGGVDGHKLTQEVLDDGGSAAVARADAARLAARHPVAFLSPCGEGAGAAVRAVGNAIPTIVADPGVPVIPGARVVRFAPNPYAEGYASGQYIGELGLPAVPKGTPHRVAALIGRETDAAARLAGLRRALARFGVTVTTFPAAGPHLAGELLRLIPQSKWLGIYLDGQFTPLSNALRQIGPDVAGRINPTAILTASSLASEAFIEASGDLGREGQVRSISDVDPTSNTAQTYTTLVSQVVGELPSLPGLSGFVAGQALAYGLVDGDSPEAITSRLRAPGVFSRAAISPWSDRDPADGTLMFRVFLPSFLTDNLIPIGPGMPGEPADGQYFPDGQWEQGASSVFTPLQLGRRLGG